MLQTNTLNLTAIWDKTFPKSTKVNHQKVTFSNRYGIMLAADLYYPLEIADKLPALAISGPFGAVKEQASGLYAQTLAESGFLTLAFDPSFTGESGGTPRYMASPDINTEDFQAAVDYLANHDLVDTDKIGIIGICGFGGLALNAAALDTRIKVTIASTMYDMSRVTANGYFDSENSSEARYQKKMKLNDLRTKEFRSGSYSRAGGCLPYPVADNFPLFVQEYSAYYKTKRGYHERSLNSNAGWNSIGTMSFLNQPILAYINEIRSAVLIVHGKKAHSYYFSETAFKNLCLNNEYLENKKFLRVEDANHTDLYDNLEKIPFLEICAFLKENLK